MVNFLIFIAGYAVGSILTGVLLCILPHRLRDATSEFPIDEGDERDRRNHA